MAQDPASEMPLNSHTLDMVPFRGGSVSTEMEADVIRGLLDANGIPSVIVAAAEFPALGFEVRVPRGQVAEAERVLQVAESTGPEAVAEAESDTE